jgi:hypothetical protein
MIFYSYLFLIAIESIVDHAKDAVRVLAPTPKAIVIKFLQPHLQMGQISQCFFVVCADVY